MIGFELVVEEKLNGYCEYSDAIYCSDSDDIWTDWLIESIETIKDINFENSDTSVHIHRNEYWGNEEQGYDFNDCLSKEQIFSLEDFKEYWNTNVKKLIEKIEEEND